MPNGKKVRCKGFTYLGLLFALAFAGVALALAGVMWHTTARRAKEQQLLFAGSAIRDAIVRYYRRSPGGIREFPRTLHDLVEDRRYITVERHLRRIYEDPQTGKRDWGLITNESGRIVGVYSKSREAPLKRDNFPQIFAAFSSAQSYADWRFSAVDNQTMFGLNALASPANGDDAAPPASGPPLRIRK
jgi:type II secretory pathway pseudopilin PulG